MKISNISIIFFLIFFSFIFLSCPLPTPKEDNQDKSEDIGKPQNVTTEIQTNNDLVIRWEAPDNRKGTPLTYIIELINPKNPSNHIKKISTSNTIVTISSFKLTADATYIIKVYTVDGKKISSAAKPKKQYVYTPKPFPPDTPRNVLITQKNNDWIITWIIPRDLGRNPDKTIPTSVTYKVELISSNSHIIIKKDDLDSTTITIASSKLRDGTTYTIRIYAKNDTGESVIPNSEIREYHISKRPSMPTNITAEQEDTQFIITWTEPADKGANPNGLIPRSITYKIKLLQGTTTLSEVDVPLPIYTTPATITLMDGKSYTVEVHAKNDTGESATAATITKTYHVSKLPVAPTNITATKQANNSLRITWKAPPNLGINPDGTTPTSDSIAYRVELIDQSDNTKKIIKEIVNTLTIDITVSDGLENGTTYTIHIYAKNNKGFSTAATKDYTYP